MLRASPCVTTLMCFSLEKRYRMHRTWDENAWMNDYRLAARGNATTFPLAWENLVEQLQSIGDIKSPNLLPRTGHQLAEVVRVLIKSNAAEKETAESLTHILHQATVRRHVVLTLIQTAVNRNHPAYQHLDMEQVLMKASELPENGIPPEIISILPHDNDLDNLRPQKNATPVPGSMSPSQAASELGHWLKPNAVVCEKSSAGKSDLNAAQVSTLKATVPDSEQDSTITSLTLTTGNRLLDQFKATYFGMAFPHVFKHCTAMPDPPEWSPNPRHRRAPDAPRIELGKWVQVMARRCEAQIGRDWTFGFTSWNLLFRSALNLSRTPVKYTEPVFDETSKAWRNLTAKDIEAGAVQLLAALQHGEYVDLHGRPKQVKGDMSKLPYVRGLQPAARKLLQNMRAVGSTLPGTQEARRTMRFEIEALRIRFGVPLFVTFSPDEAHQLLYIRMSRTRHSDPVRRAHAFQEWVSGDKDFPHLVDPNTMAVHIETMRRALPVWEQRRATLARDPLASVDGFKLLVQLVLTHLFGLHMCQQCPDCNRHGTFRTPCTSSTGSNATLVGGVFGRMDAAYITIEAQKSTGSLHAHGQCFVQCLHQHTPLQEIFSLAEDRLRSLREEYLEYVSHVTHSVYEGQNPDQIAAGIAAAEAQWPDYKTDTIMTSFPPYQTDNAPNCQTPEGEKQEAQEWAKKYLCDDIVHLQYMKQHHYHKLNPDTGERIPLRGCQRADKPGECKSDYPRTSWLSQEAIILCPCQLEARGFAQHGRKNRLCSLQGPYGHEYLNGCHPALLGGIRGGNIDVQIPYRLPYACKNCGKELNASQKHAVVAAVQRAQDAQTGYCSDYCAKNQPMAFHEIREFQKGHCQLHKDILQRGDSLDKVGKKHAMRIMSDAYLKGIVRGQVECCNLRANHLEACPVAAERVSSSSLISFPGATFLNMVRRLADKDDNVPQTTAWRKQSGQLRALDWAQAYGHRPSHSGLWELSPYEFFMYWDVHPTKIPASKKDWTEKPPETWDVTLTSKGQTKLEKAPNPEAKVRLIPGQDYKQNTTVANTRVQYTGKSSPYLQHNWYLRRKPIPQVPCFAHCPVPARLDENVDENARLAMAYFRAWTLDTNRSTNAVPHVTALRSHEQSWESALRTWLKTSALPRNKKLYRQLYVRLPRTSIGRRTGKQRR